MTRSKESLLNRILRRGEDAGLLVSTATLILVEAGLRCVAGTLTRPPQPGTSGGIPRSAAMV
jgi:hypothetical protein